VESEKETQGWIWIRSVLFVAIGLFFIALGVSWLPIVGIVVGAALVWFGLLPWIGVLRRRNVKVLLGSVSDNYLKDRRIAVVILSATKERDGFDFDPRRVDPSSVRIGHSMAGPVDDMSDPVIYARSLRDLNDDGIDDLIVYFSGDSAEIRERVEEVCVRAKTLDGEKVIGCSRLQPGVDSPLMQKLEYV
jgi:hypothetical protein